MKKDTLLFIILSVVASALSYATYPVLARILPANQYVNITVSLSLLTQITTFLSSVVALTIGLSKSEQQSNDKVQLLQALVFKLFLGLGAVFLVVSPLVLSRIHTPIAFAIPIVLMMLFSVPITIVSGYLNGKALMAKLGLLTVISAGLQFMAGALVAALTGNGLLAMLCMTFAQIATILIAYRLFASDHLPHIAEALKTPAKEQHKSYKRQLVAYTLFASLAIMAINLLQIADLLIVQTLALPHKDLKFYTDIYVISRAVFFAGMIFIWPFLGEISLDNHTSNRKPLLKLTGFFVAISLGAIGALYWLGDFITHLLFGTGYSLDIVRHIGVQSIIYKLLFLIITGVALYFVVIRSYAAVWLALGLSVCIGLYAVLVDKHSSISTVLSVLNLVAAAAAVIGIALVFRIKPKQQ